VDECQSRPDESAISSTPQEGARLQAADPAAAEARALEAATRLFAESPATFEALCEALARRAATILRDASVLRMVLPAGTAPRTVAIHHTNPRSRALITAPASDEDAGPLDYGDAFTRQVLRTDQPVLMPRVSPGQLRLWTHQRYWPVLDALQVHSVLVVPVRHHAQTLGALGVWRDQTRQAYNEDDRVFLETLTRRVAVAIARVVPR
jgi:GAF domain-containing protein